MAATNSCDEIAAASSADARSAVGAGVGHDDVRAFPREQQRHLAADAAAAADDQHDLAAELGLGGHPLQLRLFERPVLDAERFRSRQRDVVVELFELAACSGRRACGRAPASACVSSAVAPAITLMAFMKNSVVIRASFLFLPNPKSPRPGMMTTDGFESRSFGESGVAKES